MKYIEKSSILPNPLGFPVAEYVGDCEGFVGDKKFVIENFVLINPLFNKKSNVLHPSYSTVSRETLEENVEKIIWPEEMVRGTIIYKK